ncbi:MAG: DUF262 domain-containing protein [Synergistaceae bacterium]|nr:DUF262 domain-containing protein [Synergistaceae bacterium]
MDVVAMEMTRFLERRSYRFIIPVYQRKYAWKEDDCRQLWDDLKKVIDEGRERHFFGSIVATCEKHDGWDDHHIIDGQQRLTTVSLLLLAIRDLVRARPDVSEKGDELAEEIQENFLIPKWTKKGATAKDKVKLHLIESDQAALEELVFGSRRDHDRRSALMINYDLFRNKLDELPDDGPSVDDIYAAIEKLEVVLITLGTNDEPQLIFESLNSTGQGLKEGDKIRNFVLMGLSPAEQRVFYDDYWAKIEKCAEGDVSSLVRAWLSIEQGAVPNIAKVYREFKDHVAGSSIEEILKDLLRYARLYEKLLTCKSGLGERELDACMYRMKRLDITVTRPFLMEVLRRAEDKELSTKDVLDIFRITETYLFRRLICNVPSNALNKIFVGLDGEISRYGGPDARYVDKLIYALISRNEAGAGSGRFPDDDEFLTAFAKKELPQVNSKYRAYLFERLENHGTVETKDVYRHLDDHDYTIEHIMPQRLTAAWREELGEDYKAIHEEWLHRLANLTLTGYNSRLSNMSFKEKRDAPTFGYQASGLRMNQKIAAKDRWGLPELEERSAELVARAKEIWPFPQTDFVPEGKSSDLCSLDDEDLDLTGRDIAKYRYRDVEQTVKSWLDMFERVVGHLHRKDRTILLDLPAGALEGVGKYIDRKEKKEEGSRLRQALKIDEGVFIEKDTSTDTKLSILRQLFPLYDEDPAALEFYLR